MFSLPKANYRSPRDNGVPRRKVFYAHSGDRVAATVTRALTAAPPYGLALNV